MATGEGPKGVPGRLGRVRTDFLDFPTAFAIQDHALDQGPELEHHPRCSSVPGWSKISGRGLLCDCGAVADEWRRLVKEQARGDEA